MLHQDKERLENRWLIIDGWRLHSLFAAPDSSQKKPVFIVLICGLSVSSRYMIPTVLELAEEFNVCCPELPGTGKSSKPTHTLNIPELAETLDAFLRKSEIDSAVIVGHSFGCQIAAEFALRYPHKIERLILAAPSGDPSVNSAFRYFSRLLFNALLEPFSLIPIAIRDYFKSGVRRGFRTFQFAIRDRVEEKLPNIEAPTLVIRGSRDPIVSHDWAEQMTRLLPKGELITIEGAAHAVNYNSPKQFASVIHKFIQSE